MFKQNTKTISVQIEHSDKNKNYTIKMLELKNTVTRVKNALET